MGESKCGYTCCLSGGLKTEPMAVDNGEIVYKPIKINPARFSIEYF